MAKLGFDTLNDRSTINCFFRFVAMGKRQCNCTIIIQGWKWCAVTSTKFLFCVHSSGEQLLPSDHRLNRDVTFWKEAHIYIFFLV